MKLCLIYFDHEKATQDDSPNGIYDVVKKKDAIVCTIKKKLNQQDIRNFLEELSENTASQTEFFVLLIHTSHRILYLPTNLPSNAVVAFMSSHPTGLDIYHGDQHRNNGILSFVEYEPLDVLQQIGDAESKLKMFLANCIEEEVLTQEEVGKYFYQQFKDSESSVSKELETTAADLYKQYFLCSLKEAINGESTSELEKIRVELKNLGKALIESGH